MKLRFELRALRDELRRLRWTSSYSAGEENFRHLDESLAALISVLHQFDAGTLAAAKQELRRNPDLRKQVEQRARILDACDIPEVIQVRQQILRIATQALLVNHGAWCIYVLPAAFAYFSLSSLKRLIATTVSLPKPDLFRIAPSAGHATYGR
jgi:hypothetical protein